MVLIKSFYIFSALFLSASLLTVEANPSQSICDLVNEQRRQAGCGPVTLDSRLMQVSQRHNNYCISTNILTHDDPSGDLGERFQQCGYDFSSAGENVADGVPCDNPQGVMDAWMGSPGHRANILNCAFKNMGIACGGSGFFWTQDFGSLLSGSSDPVSSDNASHDQSPDNNDDQSNDDNDNDDNVVEHFKRPIEKIKKYKAVHFGKKPCIKKHRQQW